MGLFDRFKSESLYKKAYKLFNQGEYQESLEFCNQLLEIDDNIVEAWNLKGAVLEKLMLFNEALTSYDRALDLDPDFHHAWSNKGNVLKERNMDDDAIKCYNKALELDPSYSKHGMEKLLSFLS